MAQEGNNPSIRGGTGSTSWSKSWSDVRDGRWEGHQSLEPFSGNTEHPDKINVQCDSKGYFHTEKVTILNEASVGKSATVQMTSHPEIPKHRSYRTFNFKAALTVGVWMGYEGK